MASPWASSAFRLLARGESHQADAMRFYEGLILARGVPNVFPPLAGSDYLNADKNRAIKTVINGRQGEIVVNGLRFNNSMPKFPLSDDDIANVLTFVYNSFGNSGIEVTPDEVRALRAEPPDVQSPTAPRPKSEFE